MVTLGDVMHLLGNVVLGGKSRYDGVSENNGIWDGFFKNV